MKTSDGDQPQPAAPQSKRAYQPPRVDESASFERLMLACSDLPDNPGVCGFNPDDYHSPMN